MQVIVGALVAQAVSGQEPPSQLLFPPENPRLARWAADSNKTTGSLKLERAVYLPGEALSFTISITNPTASVLEIPDPWDYRTAYVLLSSKEERWQKLYGVDWAPASPHPPTVQWRVDHPFIELPAGATVTRTFDAGDRLGNAPRQILDQSYAPVQPGEYRLAHSIRGGAQFTVTGAILEVLTRVPLTGTVSLSLGPRPPGVNLKETVSVRPRATYVAALAGGGSHWIIASRNTAMSAVVRQLGAKGEGASGVGRDLSPHVRVGQSRNPVVSISVTPDANENLTIAWTDSTGKTDSVKVDKDRKPVPAGR